MASRTELDKGLTESERGVLDRGLPQPPLFPLLHAQGDYTRWKEANQDLVLALMPDGRGLVAPGWVVKKERQRIGQQMAAERASQTRENLNDLVGGLAYGAGTAWGWDADRLSDLGARYSPLQFVPLLQPHPLNQQAVVGAPTNLVHGAPTHQRAAPAPRTPSKDPASQPRPTAPAPPQAGGQEPDTPSGATRSGEEARGTPNRLRGPTPPVRSQPAAPKPVPPKQVTLPSWTLPEYSSESSFMGAMRQRLLSQRRAGKPSQLDFLLGPDGNWQKGEFTSKSGRQMRGRYALSAPDKPLVQAGHMEAKTYAKAADKPREFLMLEDADLNWLSGQIIETKGAYSSKGAVLIDGFPVDIRTARLYERHGLLTAGTVDAAPLIEPPSFF